MTLLSIHGRRLDTMFTMGIDQYGQHYDDLGKYPRKALIEKIGYRKAEKMYIDKKDGTTVHIGYIIGGLWITLYRVSRIEK
jgi:hypothetical protein